MTTAAVALFAGALLGIALISRIPIWLLGAWKERSLFGLFTAHLITYVLVAVVSTYALADGGTPQWNVAFLNYALPSLLVFLLDVGANAQARANSGRAADTRMVPYSQAPSRADLWRPRPCRPR